MRGGAQRGGKGVGTCVGVLQHGCVWRCLRRRWQPRWWSGPCGCSSRRTTPRRLEGTRRTRADQDRRVFSRGDVRGTRGTGEERARPRGQAHQRCGRHQRSGRSRLIIEDDATDEAKAVSAATKLIDQDKVVAIIGATGTGQTMAHARDIDRAGIPQVSMAGGRSSPRSSTRSSSRPRGRTARHPVQARELHEGPGHHEDRVSRRRRLRQGRAGRLGEAAEFGIEIVADQTFNPGDTDLTAAAHEDQGCGPPGMLVIAGKEAAAVAKNRQQLGIKIPARSDPRQRAQGVHRRAPGTVEGFTFPAGKILLARKVRQGHRGVQGGDRLYHPPPADAGAARHVRRSRLRRAQPDRGGGQARSRATWRLPRCGTR